MPVMTQYRRTVIGEKRLNLVKFNFPILAMKKYYFTNNKKFTMILYILETHLNHGDNDELN